MKAMKSHDGAKEKLFAQTGDGWKIALWRYRPTAPSQGLPALLVPGYPSDHRVFDPTSGRPGLSPYLAGHGRETWVVEVRTMGESFPLRGEPDLQWSIDDYLKDLYAALDKMEEVLGPVKVHLAGHSFGGFLTHHSLISPRSTRIASATTIGTPSFSALPLGILKPLAPSVLRALATMPVRPLQLSILPQRLMLKSLALLRPDSSVFGIPPHVAEYLLEKSISHAVIGIMLDYARWIEEGGPASSAGNLEKELPKIDIPFQCIGGTADLSGKKNFRHLTNLVGSREKRLILAGKASGFSRNYGHVDLVLGPLAHKEISPLVQEWMSLHDPHHKKAGTSV